MVIVIISHIGTRVLVVLAIGVQVVVLTVTATEQLVNLVTTVHGGMAGRYLSSITAAIDLLDAGHRATVDNHLRFFLRTLIVALRTVGFVSVWLVGRQVAAAIDCHHIILLE